ncbi:TMEM165/GDT1 family protein [Pseudoteredinibacter isoporae]|uniref:GDT1 family protein n=1 Tax=Pseudoteredinibacter isoporae TaxID=570281 RepID=A0A7X0MWW2_9GAMM|nr:putative Ca2+/H+ antiporter (TMEM165/GDT1 family) [Pseudoteredinibacter isoporae]NHO88369.1 TMEM165/GDT1 family protein [Pseudoteredinibacter isoporae]NIB23300.1 TMEM165/GDT1 family protein [Pseudoteredinibacter isoporae]
MDVKVFATVFITIFLAELGDKTQLATLLFAADKEVNKWTVFLGASLALVACAGIGVLLGQYASQYINEKWLNLIAGGGFILVGAWTLWRA